MLSAARKGVHASLVQEADHLRFCGCGCGLCCLFPQYLNQYLDIASLFSQMCGQMADEQPVEPLEHVIESLQFVRQQFKQVREYLEKKVDLVELVKLVE